MAAEGAAEDDTETDASLELRRFLEQREGSALRAWLRYFDTDNDQRISKTEFSRGMKQLLYAGDSMFLFKLLDADGSGELTFDEIDKAQSILWKKFRTWCVTTFAGADDFVQQIERYGGARAQPVGREGSRVRARLEPDHAPVAPTQSMGLRRLNTNVYRSNSHDSCDSPSITDITAAVFTQGVHRCGWDGSCEHLLFLALDFEGLGRLSMESLSWLNIEKKRQRRKEMAKAHSLKYDVRKTTAAAERQGSQLMEQFRLFLRKKHGGYLRAWRVALTPHDSMTLQKTQFFKACAKMAWKGDMRLLWKMFDKDESGSASIDELDFRTASVLAKFKAWCDKFGGAAQAFRAIDDDGTKRVTPAEFHQALRGQFTEKEAKLLFHGLDREGNRMLLENDMVFLDRWKPLAHLLAATNEEAMREVKEALLHKYKTYLKAWRHTLDTDSSNRCNWGEFETACRKLGFRGDVAGAWRALDSDQSGYITLREIDQASSDALLEFRSWCEDEFGGVCSAFSVFDADGSGSIDKREFRRSCRIYGFDGDSASLFAALDNEESGQLSLNSVAFLDKWEVDRDIEWPSSRNDEADFPVAAPGTSEGTVSSRISSSSSRPNLRIRGPFTELRRDRELHMQRNQWTIAEKDTAPCPFQSMRLLERQRPRFCPLRPCTSTTNAVPVPPPTADRLEWAGADRLDRSGPCGFEVLDGLEPPEFDDENVVGCLGVSASEQHAPVSITEAANALLSKVGKEHGSKNSLHQADRQRSSHRRLRTLKPSKTEGIGAGRSRIPGLAADDDDLFMDIGGMLPALKGAAPSDEPVKPTLDDLLLNPRVGCCNLNAQAVSPRKTARRKLLKANASQRDIATATCYSARF